MNPGDYYRLDLAAIRALPRRDALDLLDEIRLDVTKVTGAERARIVAAEVTEQAAAHGERGAQRRAAAALNMKPARLGQLYKTWETTMTVQAITCSDELAAVLNATPATPEDAAETPRDWIEGIWVNGTVYPLDPDATTDTLAVLADGTAAARFSPKGEFCGGRHRVGIDYDAAHWCAADYETWNYQNARGVVRDWRSVNVWDANGFSETNVYDTVEEAKAAFAEEVAQLQEMSASDDDEDDTRN